MVDGNRRELGRLSSGEPLIALGNHVGQSIEGCKVVDPRYVCVKRFYAIYRY